VAKPAVLKQDKYGNGIQILSPSGDRAAVTTSAVSQRLTIPSGAVFVRAAASAACYIKYGDSSVTATADASANTYFPAGVEPFRVPVISGAQATHVAVIQESESGVFQIEALQ
jgi:hypothetical protein